MSVTIRDVAKRLRLSITTVSRALDGYPDVAEETRERVIRTAREMDYIPSRAARQLRRKRADAIGYIIPTGVPRFSDPFFSEFIAGLGDEVALHHFDLLVSTAPPGGPEEQALYQRWMQSRRVDGIVLSRMRLQDWRVEYLGNAGSPFVALGRSHTLVDYPYIEVDSRAGFATLVRHLVERGHRRIPSSSLVNGSGLPSGSSQTRAGFAADDAGAVSCPISVGPVPCDAITPDKAGPLAGVAPLERSSSTTRWSR